MTNRWWIYQKERFPIFAHGPLVIVFCLAVLLFSGLQAGDALPDMTRIAGAVISTLILFFQLRVADEFKDFEIDSKYRPHRAVPRGLVSLQELARLAFAGAAIQFLIAMTIDIGLVPILIGVWAYIGLMTKEFQPDLAGCCRSVFFADWFSNWAARSKCRPANARALRLTAGSGAATSLSFCGPHRSVHRSLRMSTQRPISAAAHSS